MVFGGRDRAMISGGPRTGFSAGGFTRVWEVFDP